MYVCVCAAHLQLSIPGFREGGGGQFPASTAEKAPVARRQAKERWIEKAYSINSGESEGKKGESDPEKERGRMLLQPISY